MIQIRNKESNQLLGTISEQELQVLLDHLEEEDSHDQDYWVNAETIELLEAEGAPANLLDTLRDGMGSREGFELVWDRAA
jgi:hypothetical protein